MLVLRLANPETAGLESDDGFVIGQVTPATLNLLLVAAALGTVNGAVYVALRSSLPVRFRAFLWPAFAAAVGGAALVHEEGLDFQLEPVWFAIASFVLLPGVMALAVVLLAERWIAEEHPSRRLTRTLAGAAALGTIGLLVAGALCAAALAWRRLPGPLRGRLEWAAHFAVPALLLGRTVYDGIDVAQTAAALL